MRFLDLSRACGGTAAVHVRCTRAGRDCRDLCDFRPLAPGRTCTPLTRVPINAQPARAIPPFPGLAAAGPPADPGVVFQGPLARAGHPYKGEDLDVTTMSSAEPTRRDFLYIATASVGAVGAAAAAWPLIAQMNPDASTIAAGAPIEVDLAPITEGQVIKVFWRSKPIFI